MANLSTVLDGLQWRGSILNLRIAKLPDEDFVLFCASELIKNLPYSPNINIIPKINEVIRSVLKGNPNEAIIILVCQDQTPVGCLGAALSVPLFCNQKETMAVELLLFVLPELRRTGCTRHLIRAYKYWAQMVGASYISYASYKNGIEMNRIKRIK